MTTMDRRDFIKFIAAMCAGAAAMPAQLEAFEHYYFVNAPKTAGSLIAIDEILISGIATRSFPVTLKLFRTNEYLMDCSCNLFGGIMRWYAGPDQKILIHPRDFRWEFVAHNDRDDRNLLALNVETLLTGHISYIEQSGLRQTIPLTQSGNLGDI